MDTGRVVMGVMAGLAVANLVTMSVCAWLRPEWFVLGRYEDAWWRSQPLVLLSGMTWCLIVSAGFCTALYWVPASIGWSTDEGWWPLRAALGGAIGLAFAGVTLHATAHWIQARGVERAGHAGW